MAQTVVGIFDDAAEARKAVEKLTELGIARDAIDIRENTAGTASINADRDDHENGITRFFKSLFGDDDDNADRYSRVASESRCIVSVHARSGEEAERAADILDDCGAVDVDDRASRYTAASTDTDRDRDYSNRNDATISRVEENLEVGKRVEERGGVRVRSRIVERPVEEHVRLREERVNVERQPVDRPVSSADEGLFREREIEMTERTEVPVVNKEARVVEEVKLTKDVNERDETIRDTVRNTEVDVDKIGDSRTDLDSDRRTGLNTDLDRDLDRDDDALRRDRGL